MKTWKCTDGFVEKIIQAETAKEAAEMYAIIPTDVDVVEIADGSEVGEHENWPAGD